MITLSQYAGIHAINDDWKAHPERIANAKELLKRVNALLDDLTQQNLYVLVNNPKTGSQISGEIYGGFRPQSCPIGAPDSSHKVGQGVDVFDHDNALDNFLDGHPEYLAKYDLYRERAKDTLTWCHLQTRKTLSGKRTFIP